MKSNKKWTKHLKENSALIIMCLPAIIKIFIFSYLTMIGLVIAFEDFVPSKGFLGSHWNNFKNFEFFFKSESAWPIVRNTLGLNFINIVTSTIAGVIFALLLYEITSKVFLKLYQTFLFFPYFFSWVLTGLMLTTLIGSPSGLITGVIHNLTGINVNFYAEPNYWIAMIPLVNIWKQVGFFSLIYYSVLMSLDSELFEAAEIDGATRLQTIRNISIPTLIPMISVLTILAIGGAIRADFGLFFFVPRDQALLYPVTDVIDTYVYRSLTRLYDFGMSASISLFQSVVGMILILVTNKIAKSVDRDYSLF